MADTAHFGPELFEFLEELTQNNDRDWFKANKKRYERDVRDPMLQFISDLGPHLRQISPHVKVDPRPVGGSLFRIYRDVRFSKDKSPYKTHVAARFQHKRGKDVHAPGFYIHLARKEVSCGAGIWRPDSKALKTIREAIVERGDEWTAILDAPELRQTFTQDGESLKRAPKGFDADHPMIDELKRKDFVAFTKVGPEAATAPGFLDRYVGYCRVAAPMTSFIARVLDLEW